MKPNELVESVKYAITLIDEWQDDKDPDFADTKINELKHHLMGSITDTNTGGVLSLSDYVHKSKLDILKSEIQIATRKNRIRNRQLDALNFVWCSGGCEGGLHRWAEKKGVEELDELLAEAEHNIDRLRTYVNSYKSRLSR